MSTRKKIQARTTRRTHRVRNHLKKVNRACKLRVCVQRSNKETYAQIIDDAAMKTVLSFSTKQIEAKTGDKTEQAKLVGLALGKQALENSINEIYFDRGKYIYHGRIKALAEGLRESGLNF